jgi:hypothetical protein
MAYCDQVLRGRAASTVALGVSCVVGGLVGCSYDRSNETLVAAPVVTAAPPPPPASLPCGPTCPHLYGPPPWIDPYAYSPECYTVHQQYWAQFAGNPDPASVQRFGAAMAAVGAGPAVVDAAQRWAQARVDHLARHQAAVAREATGGDLATDPDYIVVYGVFTGATFVGDNETIVASMTALCSPRQVIPDTR